MNHPILDALASGPATGAELAVACGYDADDRRGQKHVTVMVSRLRRRGFAIENVRFGGSHGGAVYLINSGRRRCQSPGCITLLSSDNTRRYCRRHELTHVPDDALDLLICALEMDCGGDESDTNQLILEVMA